MDRVTQTAITVAAIGAVAVAAGVVIGLQTHLGASEQTAQQSARDQTPVEPVLRNAEPQNLAGSDDTQAVYIDDEIELSTFGEPMFDTEIFNPVARNRADTDTVEDDPDTAADEDAQNEGAPKAQPQNGAARTNTPSAAQATGPVQDTASPDDTGS